MKERSLPIVVKFCSQFANTIEKGGIDVIDRFRDKYSFLSNMYASPIVLGSVHYTCAEAAFQAVKLKDKTQRVRFQGLSGSAAKQLGRKVQLREDWNTIRIDVMRWVIKEKFSQNPELAKRLVQTGSEELIERNTWGDKFWGVCNGVGQNNLGKILMDLRSTLQKEE